MNSDLPQSVEKIVNDYLGRLAARLQGMPAGDRRELVDEIRSHIYESYVNESAGDDIERILAVLRRLGDPADVISSRMPQAIARLGRGKRAPLYILAGILIAMFGVPLGIGAAAILVGLLAGLLGLMIAFYGAGVSLVVAGFFTSVASVIAILAPGILYSINDMVGSEVVQFGPFQHNPQMAGIIGLITSLIVIGLGLLMLWSGKYLWRGFRFIIVLVGQKVRSIFDHWSREKREPSGIPVPASGHN